MLLARLREDGPVVHRQDAGAVTVDAIVIVPPIVRSVESLDPAPRDRTSRHPVKVTVDCGGHVDPAPEESQLATHGPGCS